MQNKTVNFISARGIVFNSKNEILVVSRDNLIWELPGGGVDEVQKSSEQIGFTNYL